MTTAADIQQGRVKVATVMGYMREHGWRVGESRNPLLHLLLFADETGRDIKLYVPREDDAPEAPQRLAEVVDALAVIHQIPAAEIIAGMGRKFKDVLNIRILRDNISLEQASDFVRYLKNLISYSASLESRPVPHFFKALPIGSRQIQKAYLGQTKVGSFVFTIESPIMQPTVPSVDVAAPFNRRVIERIVRGLKQVAEAAGSGDRESIPDQFRYGLNANLMDVLTAMYETARGSELEFSVDWALSLPPAPDLAEVKGVTVDPQAYMYMQLAAGILRPHEPAKEVEVCGYVFSLTSETMQSLVAAPVVEGDEGGDDGTEEPRTFVPITPVTDLGEIQANNMVRLRWHTAGATKSVTVFLGPVEYGLAIDAHRAGRKLCVRGDLRKVRNRLYLDNPHNVRIL